MSGMSGARVAFCKSPRFRAEPSLLGLDIPLVTVGRKK